MTVRRRRLLLLVLLVGLSAAPLGPIGSASGSCAGPELQVAGATGDRPVLHTGRPLQVEGRHFVEGCDDTGESSVLGCSRSEESEETPMTRVRLTLVQGDRKWVLGTADAGTGADRPDRGHVGWDVRLPDGVVTGRATLVAGSARLPVLVDVVRHADR